MKNKILVLGATGLIGHQTFNYLSSLSIYEMYSMSYRNKLNSETIVQDAREESRFIDRIKELKPDFIVNCIGVLIRGSEVDPANAVFLNGYLPHRLKILATEINAKLIHISTDCVFSGQKGQYKELDLKDGTSMYARTKAVGEVIDKNNLTLRTSVVGPELKEGGEELFHWFMLQDKKVSGYTKSIWSGVTTIELAKCIRYSIDKGITGLHHITNNSSINKYDLLVLFKKATKKEIIIECIPGNKTDKSFIDTRNELGYVIPGYDQMITEMVMGMSQYENLYSQYDIKIQT